MGVRERVTKAGEIIDPELEAEIDALVDVYGDTIKQMQQAVERARQIMLNQQATGTLDLRLFQEVLATEVVKALQTALRDVSNSTLSQVLRDAKKAMENLPAGISIKPTFNAKDPRAIVWAENHAGTLIKQIEAEALVAIRRIISETLLRGGGIIGASGRISRIIGLHDRWQTAVDNLYIREFEREFLRTGNATTAESFATRLAEDYRTKLIEARALVIARTEVIAAQNVGQIISWYQLADQGYLDLSRAYKEWVVGPSGWKGVEVCEVCLELGGMPPVPINSVFTNGDIAPPAHPNCRCTMNLIPLAEDEDIWTDLARQESADATGGA